MLENIVRHMEKGKPAMQAALDGCARNRFHDSVDDAVADRGVHSVLLMGGILGACSTNLP